MTNLLKLESQEDKNKEIDIKFIKFYAELNERIFYYPNGTFLVFLHEI